MLGKNHSKRTINLTIKFEGQIATWTRSRRGVVAKAPGRIERAREALRTAFDERSKSTAFSFPCASGPSASSSTQYRQTPEIVL